MTERFSEEIGNSETGKTVNRVGFFWFPLATLVNTFSMTALMVILGVAGHPDLAASVGLVQGATVATFYVFSANARNLILADVGELAASRLLQLRLVLLLPLAGIAYFLSAVVGGIDEFLALVLILRRAFEWVGELGISQLELSNQKKFAQRAVFTECTAFFLCILMWMGLGIDLGISAIPWAFVPLISVFSAQLSLRTSRLFTIYSLFPHIGSTTIVGVSVYVFRISLAMLVGKAVAGELFTAFAIGGVVPTIFGHALAPTLLRHLGPKALRSKLLMAFPFAMLVVVGGGAVLVTSHPVWMVATGHSSVFWLATGFSLAGGAIMIFATLLRALLLHSREDVFGPDIMANILLVISIPLIYFSLGVQALAGLYLLSACLNLVFIWGAVGRKRIEGRLRHLVLIALGVLLVTPLFFQLEGNLFRDSAMFFVTGGNLLSLPIPLSVLALLGGIAILGNYSAAKRSLMLVFFTMLLFVVSVIYTNVRGDLQGSIKIVMFSQFLLPMLGVVLGEMFAEIDDRPIFEYSALLILLLVLPAQLAATWIEGHTQARPLVFTFSIYQHLSYFPVIVTALAAMASLALWTQSGSMRFLIGVLSLVVWIHMIASMSVNAVVVAATGMAALLFLNWRITKYRRQLSFILVVCLVAATAYAILLNLDYSPVNAHLISDVSSSGWSVSAINENERTRLWRYFAEGVTSSTEIFLFGHASRPDYTLFPNANNYWLDAVYSFGMLSILPLVLLISSVIHLTWKHRIQILRNPLLLGTSLASGFLVLVEGIFNIGMRQPYPGILTFFILGLLVCRLESIKLQ